MFEQCPIIFELNLLILSIDMYVLSDLTYGLRMHQLPLAVLIEDNGHVSSLFVFFLFLHVRNMPCRCSHRCLCVALVFLLTITTTMTKSIELCPLYLLSFLLLLYHRLKRPCLSCIFSFWQCLVYEQPTGQFLSLVRTAGTITDIKPMFVMPIKFYIDTAYPTRISSL
jgi:hypothetical protein